MKKMANALRKSAVVFSLPSCCTLFSYPSSRNFCNPISPPSSFFYKPLLSSSSQICVSLDTDNAVTSLPDNALTNDVSALRAAAKALDIRVGCILKVWRHTEANSLFVEEVNVCEPEPCTIYSRVVKYIGQDEFQGRNVVVLADLKRQNLRGVKSNGMLMAASDSSDENIQLLASSEGSVPGQ